jgi:ornithine cyclodeaminase/alanine dehydrogenase-like protein (mu-crystallin family)
MGVLILRPQDHRGLLTIAEGVQLMRRGFEEFARSPVTLSNPRTRTNTTEGLRMTVHQGVTPSMRAAVTTGRSEKVEILPNGLQRYTGRGRPTFILFDSDTAELLMVMIGEPRPRGFEDFNAMAGFQTACAAAVSIHMVARPNALRVGVLGSGGQASLHLAAMAALRSIPEAVVYSPTRAHREAYAETMQELLGFPIEPVDRTEDVLAFAEILLVCTNSNVPVLDGKDLKPGTHVYSIVHSNKELLRAGLVPRMRQEIDDETLRRSQLVVTTNKLQEELDEPEVLWGAAQRGVIRWSDVAETSDIIAGRVSPESTWQAGGITFLHNPAGWGIGVAAFIRGFYDRAREAGRGLILDDVEGFEPVYGL